MGIHQARVKQTKLLSVHILAKGKAMMQKLIPFEKTKSPQISQVTFYRNTLQQQHAGPHMSQKQAKFYNYEQVFSVPQASHKLPQTNPSPPPSSTNPQENPALAKLITKVKLGKKMLAEASINEEEFFLALGLSKSVVKELLQELSQRKLI